MARQVKWKTFNCNNVNLGWSELFKTPILFQLSPD